MLAALLTKLLTRFILFIDTTNLFANLIQGDDLYPFAVSFHKREAPCQFVTQF